MSEVETLVVQTANRPWAIRRETLGWLRSFEGREIAAGRFAARTARAADMRHGTVSVVPLHGIVTPAPSILSMLFGSGDASLSTFETNLTAALGDPETTAVVLDVDSPGGLVDGVPESAEWVRRTRDAGKPIVAVAHHLMASAAYWIASQAHEVVVSPSSEVGSIGVYQAHTDLSGAAEKAGVKTTLISAGKYKTEASPFEPLTDEASAHLQEAVDDLYGMFTQAVAVGRSRGTQTVTPQAVRDGYAQGRTVVGKRAVTTGLADRVATLSETVARLQDGGGARVARTAGDRAAEAAPPSATESAPEPIRASAPFTPSPNLLDALRALR